MRVAAVQLSARLGDVDSNLQACARLVEDAVRAGAEWVVLPEFFPTGVGFDVRLRDEAPEADGRPAAFLGDEAARHGIHLGGSAMVRDHDGEVRNAFLLAAPDGTIAGRHDKDIPTGWENALYVGGQDDGVLAADELTIGAAMCWEFMRTGTARRLAGRVDLVLGGSGWWSVPLWTPHRVFSSWEHRNEQRAVLAPQRFANFVGAAVVHGAHCGPLDCPLPMTGLTYRGRFEGGASITAADGSVLAARRRDEGPGVVVADLDPIRVSPRPLPSGFWLHDRGVIGSVMWHYQGVHGRWKYAHDSAR